ncbi:MAG TPA: helix-turn-helix transcriptional regulator [Sphingomicrobium sp.]
MEELYALIAALHEGAIDDEHWLAALDRMSDAFGGAGIFLGTTQRSGSGFELSGHRVDPQWIELVNGELAGHEANPIYATVSSALRADPMGTIMRPIVLSRHLASEAYRSSPIYIHAIAPAGHEHAMAMVLLADSASALSLTLVRPAASGDFAEHDTQLARALGPHILGALKLRHQFAIARSGALMLDRFDHGVLLLAGSGHLVHANAEAQRLLDARDGLSVTHGELRGAYPADTQRLRQMISEADRAARGASLQPRPALRLPRPSGRPELVIRALPVAPVVASSFGVGELATIALFVHDPEKDDQPVEELIAEGLGLTQAEAAVAARVWEGDSVAEAAERLGVSPNTVKTHLKAVFEKTGVERQAALVRKIAQMLAAMGHH